MVQKAKLYLIKFRIWLLNPIFAPRPHLGNVGRMDPKPPPSCEYSSRPSAPNHISKSMFQKYILPYPLKVKMPILYPKKQKIIFLYFSQFPILALCKSLKSFLIPNFLGMFLAVIFTICQDYNFSVMLLFFRSFLQNHAHFSAKVRPIA